MAQIEFEVINQLTEQVSENVLVFLMPVGANRDYTFAAWQVLNPGANGGSIPFEYDTNISVAAMSQGDRNKTPLTPINPGQLLDATTSEVGSVQFSSNPSPLDRLTSQQAGILNRTNPSVMLETEWYVNGDPTVKIKNLNKNKVTTFELEASLYFYAAIPTKKGFNYTLQQVSAQTQYVIPAGTKKVTVTWSRPGGISDEDKFTFNPPSLR
ncbi:MAG: hypothetical protein RM021_004930 [Nostoc sp. EkiNYC01]|nr:hypothetical protein [Nostoc sp. EkiNYC01]